MKVELEKLKLGHSSLTDRIFIGTVVKSGDKWINKVDVTNDFIACVLARWENQKEVIESDKGKWEISVKKIIQ